MEGIKIGDTMLYDVEGLAKALGVQERTVRKYLREGKLQGRKLARKWYVTAASLLDYFRQPEQQAGQQSREAGPAEQKLQEA